MRLGIKTWLMVYFVKSTRRRRYTVTVAYLGFCKGGSQSQRREVRGAGGANGVECGEGVSPPH